MKDKTFIILIEIILIILLWIITIGLYDKLIGLFKYTGYVIYLITIIIIIILNIRGGRK